MGITKTVFLKSPMIMGAISCVVLFIMMIGCWMQNTFNGDNPCRLFGSNNPTAQTPLLAVITNNAEAHVETIFSEDPTSMKVETAIL